MMNSGETKTVLVTGASAGIGYATADLLGKSGFRVFGTGRNVSGKKIGSFETLPLDVTSDDSVVACISTVMNETGRIDVLINNAGIGTLGALEEATVPEARAIFDTNFFGTVRMVDAALPEMRKRKSGMIINLGSMAASVPVPYHGFLTASKAAINSYTDALRFELNDLGIKVILMEPGMVRTHIGEQCEKLKTRRTIDDYHPLEDNVVKRLELMSRESIDPGQVAEVMLKAVTAQNPLPHYMVGKEKRLVSLAKLLPVTIVDSMMKRRLGMID